MTAFATWRGMVKYSTESDNDTLNTHLEGRFTFSDHGTFRNMVADMVNSRQSRHVIDLSGVEFIDSAGLGMLLLARDEGKRHDLTVVLRAPQGQVKRMLEVARFDTMFDIET